MKSLISPTSLPIFFVIKSALFFAVFIALLLASVYGVPTPPNIPVKQVGFFQLAPYDSGLALYQGMKGYYYTFSPFNDYFVTPDGIRSSFLIREDLDKKRYTTSLNQPKWISIPQTIETYFALGKPEIMFTKLLGGTIDYRFQEQGTNQFMITRRVSLPENGEIAIIGTTLPYQVEDFVFDTSGNLFSHKKTDDIVFFSQLYNFSLRKAEITSRTSISSKKIYIVNPSLPGAIALERTDNQTIWLSPQEGLIEFEEKVQAVDDAPIATSITVSIVDSL